VNDDMPARKDPDASASVPAFYGAELRFKREAAGMTLEELAEGCFYGVAYLSQIEHGQRRIPLDLARHADQVLNTDGFFERRAEDVRKARKKGLADYFADAAEQEKTAATIADWAPTLIPGLLQTADYARAVTRATTPFAASEEVEEKVTARMERGQLLDDADRPEFWVILHELVIRQPTMNSAAMAEQLNHIVELSRQGRVLTQVVPLNAGTHPFMMGMTRFMTFADAPPLLYQEGLHHGQLFDDPSFVRKYMKSYDLLRAAALPPKASLSLIETAAGDFRDDRITPHRPELRHLAQELPQQRDGRELPGGS
jgi:transcriptional regulator with XRE-family HTH domain